MKIILTFIMLISISAPSFATRKISYLDCTAQVNFGEQTYPGEYLYQAYKMGTSPIVGKFTHLGDGKLYEAFSVKLFNINPEKAQAKLNKDELAQHLLSGVLGIPTSSVQSYNIVQLLFDEGNDGNAATFYKFLLHDKTEKTAGMIGWGVTAKCM